MEIKQQDHQFVEWSSGINEKSFDMQLILKNIKRKKGLKVLDVGGGIGTFAKLFASSVENSHVTVVDPSPLSKEKFITHQSTSFYLEDFLKFNCSEKFDIIIFRTVLHHIIGGNEFHSLQNQVKALQIAKGLLNREGVVYVLENVYEPIFLDDVTGRLIFKFTRMKIISKIIRKLGANTAGEGVRFRSLKSWENCFSLAGMEIKQQFHHPNWGTNMPVWQRFPLLCKKRYQCLFELHKE